MAVLIGLVRKELAKEMGHIYVWRRVIRAVFVPVQCGLICSN